MPASSHKKFSESIGLFQEGVSVYDLLVQHGDSKLHVSQIADRLEVDLASYLIEQMRIVTAIQRLSRKRYHWT